MDLRKFKPGQLLRSNDLNILVEAVEELRRELRQLSGKVDKLGGPGTPPDLKPVFEPSCLTLMPGDTQQPMPFRFGLQPTNSYGMIAKEVNEAIPDQPIVRISVDDGTITPKSNGQVNINIQTEEGQNWTVAVRVEQFDPDHWSTLPVPGPRTCLMFSPLLPSHQLQSSLPGGQNVSRLDLSPWIVQNTQSLLLLFFLSDHPTEAIVNVELADGSSRSFHCPLICKVGQAPQFQEVLLAWDGVATRAEANGAAVVGIGHRRQRENTP